MLPVFTGASPWFAGGFIVIVFSFPKISLNVTVTGLSPYLTPAPKSTLYVTSPPSSVNVPVDVNFTVVVSSESFNVTLFSIVTEPNYSKFPPVTVASVALKFSMFSTYTSSLANWASV